MILAYIVNGIALAALVTSWPAGLTWLLLDGHPWYAAAWFALCLGVIIGVAAYIQNET